MFFSMLAVFAGFGAGLLNKVELTGGRSGGLVT
jgi:hypothetical protein